VLFRSNLSKVFVVKQKLKKISAASWKIVQYGVLTVLRLSRHQADLLIVYYNPFLLPETHNGKTLIS